MLAHHAQFHYSRTVFKLNIGNTFCIRWMLMSLFVIFDTCTHASYYGDVHQVLAFPEGAVIRYEYKRRLFTPDAALAIDDLTRRPLKLPMPALLMYGQKRGFVQGSKDPQTMLTTADSVFVPTRSANLV